MTRRLAQSDFRAVRVILEPGDFALGGDEPDPSPSDLILENTWYGIMNLPDDVAIRTSDHRGKVLGEAYWLWGRWIEATGEAQDALFAPMLDAHDDLQTSLFNSLHGYYRAAFSSLRNVIELMTIGTCGAITKSPLYEQWRNGSTELKFGAACDLLSNDASLVIFNQAMRSKGHESLWDARRTGSQGGYSRSLYKNMCDFAHSRPGFSNGDLWCSNGPIYVSNVFWDWYYAYLRTTSLCAIMMFLARPTGEREAFEDLFTNDPNILPMDLLEALKLAILQREAPST
jgi:hypothetical protein